MISEMLTGMRHSAVMPTYMGWAQVVGMSCAKLISFQVVSFTELSTDPNSGLSLLSRLALLFKIIA